MRRPRITITLNQYILQNLDKLIDGRKIRNRSHAIEYVLSSFFRQTAKKAVILAGGVEVGNPILAYLIENLKKSSIHEVIICIGHSGDKIMQFFGNGEKFGIKIFYSKEDKPLHTGGALLKIKSKLLDSFLVVHGDILTNLDFKDLLAFHEEENALATIALTTVDKPAPFGQLKLHGTKLVDFIQKPDQKKTESNLINCGIYVFSPEIFNYFPKNKKEFMLEDIIEKLIEQKKVNGFVFEGQWSDVGKIKEYLPPNQKSKTGV